MSSPSPLPALDVDTTGSVARSERLRALHRPGDPLVLVNVWDAVSARTVEAAGARALATSSAAVAAALGEADGDVIDPELAFAAVSRIAAGAAVPVTADVEAGYRLAPEVLVERLLAAGAVGCNLEDSDHRRRGALVDADVVAERLRAVRAAADRAGVPLVVNARIDTFLHGGGDPGAGRAPGTAAGEALLDETVRRARLYLAAGADCVYPIRLVAPSTVSRLVEVLDAPVNANLGPGTTVADLAAAGASRVSFGPSLQGQLMAELGRRAAELTDRPDSPSRPSSGDGRPG